MPAPQIQVWPRGAQRVRSSGPLGISFGSETRRVGRPIGTSEYGSLVQVEASNRYETGFGGDDLAAWTIKPFGGWLGGMFTPGDHVRITKGGTVLWEGTYSGATPNDDGTWTLRARGYAYRMMGVPAVFWNAVDGINDIYYPTTQLGAPDDTAEPLYGWGYAVEVLGMPITGVIGDTTGWDQPFGETDRAATVTYLGDLVTGNASKVGKKWTVWGRTLEITADPTDPTWSYNPPDSVVGTEDTDYRTRIGVYYVWSGPAAWSVGTTYSIGTVVVYQDRWWRALASSTGVTPVEGSTWQEQPIAYRPSDFTMLWVIDEDAEDRVEPWPDVVDYRGLGKIDNAAELGAAVLEQVGPRLILSGATFTLGTDDGWMSVSGGWADPAFVRAGEAVRLANVRTSTGLLMPADNVHVVSAKEWTWQAEDDSESTQIRLAGSVQRSLGELLAGRPLDAASVISGRPAA